MVGFVVHQDVETPMRDGVVLRADLWRPSTDEPCATVLMRTPYGKSEISAIEGVRPEQLARAGFNVLVQDTRGRGASDGEWRAIMWEQEGEDGYDTIAWTAAQSWSTDQIGMAGQSYLAIVQLFAAALQPPCLQAIAPSMVALEEFDLIETGGAFRLDHLYGWLAFMGADWLKKKIAEGDAPDPAVMQMIAGAALAPRTMMDHRPIVEAPAFAASGFPVHPEELFNRTIGAAPRGVDLSKIDVPVLSIGGWYDVFQRSSVGLFQNLSGRSAADHELLMGGWAHSGALTSYSGSQNFGIMGSARAGGVPDAHISFFRRHLNGETVDAPSRVRYYLLNANSWCTSETWPPAQARKKTLWLSSRGRAARRSDDGRMLDAAPNYRKRTDEFLYDPERPTPTRGGRTIYLGGLVMGPVDQAPIEQRADVAVYTSDPLGTDVDIVGEPELVLWISSNRRDTDFVSHLCDVSPEGVSTPFAEGMIRARFRNGFDREAMLEPGRVEEVRISLGHAAWRLAQGHRLRVMIASANYPHIDPNMNTGGPPGVETTGLAARNRVHHGGVHPSRLELPVLTDAAGSASAKPAQTAISDPDTNKQPSWKSSEVPAREDCVLRYVLERHERERGDQVFAVFDSGETWTYRDAAEAARNAGAGLRALGVRQGERVLSWFANGPDAMRIWFGANWIGATYVPLNTSYRGGILQHTVNNSDAAVIVADAAFAPRLSEVEAPKLAGVVVRGELDARSGAYGAGREAKSFDLLTVPAEDDVVLERPIEPWDEQSIIFTSGTTGPSKGVLSSYCHLATTAAVCFEERDSEDLRYLVNLPLFHVGGTVGTYAMLLLGRSAAIVERFRTDEFWPLIRRLNANCCTLLGAMASFLLRQPTSADDKDHCLSWAFLIPLLETSTEFRERFGIDLYTLFNMSEISCPIVSEKNPTIAGACGVTRDGVEARLVDAHDEEVSVGEIGEMILRVDRPWSMNHGYNAMPEATAEAWRNGWFHTGDGFKQDELGNFYFVDRMKDAIRRRGENVSSFEVEAEFLSHPSVREAAAVAVPSEYGEDEILIVVSPAPGHEIDPKELILFCRTRMAHFMVPRFVRVLPELPKTPTEKVRKVQLREEGLTGDVWDREAHGVTVKHHDPD